MDSLSLPMDQQIPKFKKSLSQQSDSDVEMLEVEDEDDKLFEQWQASEYLKKIEDFVVEVRKKRCPICSSPFESHSIALEHVRHFKCSLLMELGKKAYEKIICQVFMLTSFDDSAKSSTTKQTNSTSDDRRSPIDDNQVNQDACKDFVEIKQSFIRGGELVFEVVDKQRECFVVNRSQLDQSDIGRRLLHQFTRR